MALRVSYCDLPGGGGDESAVILLPSVGARRRKKTTRIESPRLLKLYCVEQAELVFLPLIIQKHKPRAVAIELHLFVGDVIVAGQEDELMPVRAACELLP